MGDVKELNKHDTCVHKKNLAIILKLMEEENNPLWMKHPKYRSLCEKYNQMVKNIFDYKYDVNSCLFNICKESCDNCPSYSSNNEFILIPEDSYKINNEIERLSKYDKCLLCGEERHSNHNYHHDPNGDYE